MAFILDKMATIRAADKSANSYGKYTYRTTDARATVLASNYFRDGYTLVPNTDTATTTSTGFQDCAPKFYVGDIIEIQQIDSSNRPLDEYQVVVAHVVTGGSAVVYVEEMQADEIVAVGQLTDISTASNVDIAFGQEVELTQVTTYLGGAITVADAAITVKEDSSSGDTVEGGSITVAFTGSAAGDKDTSNPYAQRTATTFNVASDGASTGTQTLDIVLRGRVVEGKVEKVTIRIPDISTASSADTIACPVKGTIKKIESTLQGAITVGDAAITTKIGTPAAGTNITGGALTIANASSAAGDIDTATPTAANAVDEGELLSAISDGGSTDAAALYVTFYIMR